MNFKKNFLINYLKQAPVSLAVERTMECQIFSRQEFSRPILDLGCGEGLFSYILFDEKIDVGIEPNVTELQKARGYQIYNELIGCYGDKIPKESSSFNSIFSNSVLEHVRDIDSVFREVRRLLTSQGRFYLTVPTNLFDSYSVIFQLLVSLHLHSLAGRYRAFFNKFWRHYYHYDRDGWIRIFHDTGFEVLKTQEYCNKRVCLLNDMFIPFSLFSFIVKKLSNKWFLFKSFRAFYAPLFCYLLSPIVQVNEKDENCGLIFFCLKKTSRDSGERNNF